MLTDAQIRFRQSGLTATDMTIVSGENPWGSIAQVYDEKTMPAELLLERSVVSSSEALTGQVLEAALARRYAIDAAPADGRCLRIVQVKRTLQHPVHKWALATPDRYVFCLDKDVSAKLGHSRLIKDVQDGRRCDWMLECKLVGHRVMQAWDLSAHAEQDVDRVPSYVNVQVQWQMFVGEQDRVDVAALLGGTTFRTFEIRRDEQYIGALVRIGEAFWERVQSRRPPEPDGSEAYERFLDRVLPQRSSRLAAAPEGADRLARLYKDATRRSAEAKKEARGYVQALRSLAEGHVGIRSEAFQATWFAADGRSRCKLAGTGREPAPGDVGEVSEAPSQGLSGDRVRRRQG